MNFQQIYDEYKNSVFNLALQYVGNIQDAEEITQDVFVKIYEKLNQFRNDSNIKTWIYRITVNHSIDFLRAKKRQKRTFWSIFSLNDENTTFEIPHFNHPGIEMEHKEELEFVFKCLNQLPENQKTVIILLKIEELSQKEVAEIMKISVKAVESLFQRGKKNLEKLLNKNEGI